MPSPANYSGPALLPVLAFSSKPAIIDVEHSFRKAVERYTLLNQEASSLITDIATLSPQDILVRSKQLASMQQDLASQDAQLIAILTLAGLEIVNTPFVRAYQDMLVKVSLTFDQIWEQTSLVKKNLLKGSTIHGKLDTLFQD